MAVTTALVAIKFPNTELRYGASFYSPPVQSPPQQDLDLIAELVDRSFVEDVLSDETAKYECGEPSLVISVGAPGSPDGQFALGDILGCFRRFGYDMHEQSSDYRKEQG